MKVVCIKFTSGEEIIAKVADTQLLAGESLLDQPEPWCPKGTLSINTVRVITFQPVGHNQLGVAFVPWSIGNTDGDILIDLSLHVVAIYSASNDIERGFLEQTSGISLARPGLKI